MSQSLVKNYIHIVFSTKYRQPLIHEPHATELYKYLAGICKNLRCNPVKIGGYVDHVHVLCMLSKSILLQKLVQELKSHSSKWMKTRSDTLSNFYWQDGYGAFAVNAYQIDIVQGYIENQTDHHRQKSFQEEYRSILKKHNVEYDEKYVWD